MANSTEVYFVMLSSIIAEHETMFPIQ